MKNKNKNYKGFLALYIVVAVILGLLTLVSVANITGNSFLQNLFGTRTESAGAILNLKGVSPIFGNETRCADTDGGIFPYVKGTVSYYVGNNTAGLYTDYCWLNGKNVTNSTSVVEYYCFNDKPNSTLAYCPGGCINGACMNMSYAVLLAAEFK